MGFDLMRYLGDAWSWAGGATSKDGEHSVEGGVTTGGGMVDGDPGGLLGGMVGGFGMPMDWKGAGFGTVANGKLSNDKGGYLGGHLGGGMIGGYSTWDGTDSGGYDVDGVSGGLAGVAPVGVVAGNKDVSANASTNVYRGLGGSAYTYEKGSDHGVGLKGSYTPVGLADTNLGVTTEHGSAKLHADSAYLGKHIATSKFGEKDGTYYGDVSYTKRMGVEGVKGNVDTDLGEAHYGIGELSKGPRYSLGGSYNSETGAGEVHGSTSGGGFLAKNVTGGWSSPDGNVHQDAGFGQLRTGYKGEGRIAWDPEKGMLTADGQGRGGGMVLEDVHSNFGVKGIYEQNASLGEFSNDVTVKDVHAEFDSKHSKIGGSVDGGGVRFEDAKVNTTFGSGPDAVKANAHMGSLGSGDSITKAYLQANYDSLETLGAEAGFEELAVGGWAGEDIGIDVTGPMDSHVNANLGSFNQGLVAQGGKAKLDKNGLATSLDHAQYDTLNLKDINLKGGIGDLASVDGHLGEFGSNHVTVDGAEAGLTFDKGLYAKADKARYDAVYLDDLSYNANVGDLYKSHLELGEGSYNHFSGKNLDVGVTKDGLHAKLEDGKYRYLAGKDIGIEQEYLGGAYGYGLGADEASLGGVDIGKLDYKSNGLDTHLAVEDLGAHGWKSKNIHAEQNIGDLGGKVGADELNILDLNIGKADVDTQLFGTRGKANVEDAKLDLLNVKDGHAGLSWDGKEVLGARGDYRAGAGLGKAEGEWDLLGKGKGRGSFKDASYSQQLENASVNLFGTELSLPDAGFKANASGDGNVDLNRGAADANVSLGGSSVNFGGNEITVPEWVRASAGVDLSRGASNWNLGGDEGVGMDASIADGNLDVNVFGNEIDVDEGIRDGAQAVGDGARAVGGAIADGASAAWDAVPSVSLPSLW